MAWQIAGFCGLVAGFACGVAVTLILLSIVADAWVKAVKFEDAE